MLERMGQGLAAEEAKTKRTFAIVLNKFLIAACFFTVVFCLVHVTNDIFNRKIENMRNEIRNEVIAEVNKSLEVRDRIMAKNVKVANDNMLGFDMKIAMIWRFLEKNTAIEISNAKALNTKIEEIQVWLKEETEISNRNTKAFGNQFLTLREQLEVFVGVANDNVDTVDKKFNYLFMLMGISNPKADKQDTF